MEWDIRNDQPIYTQLIQQVTLAILSGTFPCGGRLPPVREMAAEAGVNPNTAAGAGGAGAHGAGLHPAHCRALCYRGRRCRRQRQTGAGPPADRSLSAPHGAHGLRPGADRPAGAVLGGGRIRDGYFRM